MRRLRIHSWLLLLAGAWLGGCTQEIVTDPLSAGETSFDPDRPELADPEAPAPYAGDDPTVIEAQAELRTGFDLQAKVIRRTCGPTGGVCHNTKEYPDLHTPANFVQAIGAPCNVQPGSYEAVYDRCELPGDRVELGDGVEREIGWLEYVPGVLEMPESATFDAMTPGLHIYLDQAISTEADAYAEARFIRKFITEDQRVAPLPYFSFETRWHMLDGGTHIIGEVREYQADNLQELTTVGVVQGDMNRNGAYGARTGDPVSLLAPGRPEESYLVARLRGEMLGERIPGSRMPLANQPLSVAEMLALFCFIEGLPSDPATVNLASLIDYAGCSYSANPEDLNLLGSGVTWAARISQVLEFNCGGCHSDPAPQAGLSLKDGNVYARLLEPSSQLPDLKLIEPFDPSSSYLWLKVTGDARIMGSRMPLDPLNGDRRLTDAELDDIRAWIEAGAVENR